MIQPPRDTRVTGLDWLGLVLLAIMLGSGLRFAYVLFVGTVAALWGSAP